MKIFKAVVTGFVSVAVFLAVQPAFAQSPARVLRVEGDVKVTNAQGDWVNAEEGDELATSAAVRTGEASSCDIAFDIARKNIVSIGANSDVSIGQYLKKIHITQGRVFTKLDGLAEGEEFEVVTPVAIAGARGTAWETIVFETVQFSVEDDTIKVQGIDPDGALTDKLDVTEGFMLEVNEGGVLGRIKELSIDDLNRLKDWTEKIKSSVNVSQFQGDLNDLLADLLEEEEGGEEDSFAGDENEFSEFQQQNQSPQGLLGGDITTTSFIENQNQQNDSGPSAQDRINDALDLLDPILDIPDKINPQQGGE